MTKQRELLLWMRDRKVFKTSDILHWGVDNFSNRSSRSARDFAEQGLIRRLSKFEKEVRGLNGKEGYYEINAKMIEEYLQPKLF